MLRDIQEVKLEIKRLEDEKHYKKERFQFDQRLETLILCIEPENYHESVLLSRASIINDLNGPPQILWALYWLLMTEEEANERITKLE